MSNPLRPDPSLLVKLGSIAVHSEEMLSPGRHDFDAQAIKSLLTDSAVKKWVAEMDSMALLPVKRGERQ